MTQAMMRPTQGMKSIPLHTRKQAGRYVLLALALLALVFSNGCSKPREAKGVLDTPEHHANVGYDKMDQNRWEDAEREFNLALDLDKKYSPALGGKAVVEAHKAQANMGSEKLRDKSYDAGKSLFKDALSNAADDTQKRLAHVNAIRVHTLTQMPSKWVEEAEDHYNDAVETDKKEQDPLPHFYMARAYRDGLQLNKALKLYEKVLALDKGKTAEADKEMSVVQNVIRANPGSRTGKLVAFLDHVSRADVAAVFIEELSLANIYARNAQVDNSFKSPEQAARGDRKASDVEGHPLQSDIEEVLRIGITGLEVDGSGHFFPDKATSRAEFAVMVEDILTRVTGENLKSKFIGQESPFRDVRNDLPYFNAVMTVSSRGLMEAKNKVRGLFAPTDPMTGVEALLVVRAMKNELKSYLR